jgi:transposase
MLSFPANVRLYLANRPVDGRKSFNGLAAVVETEFELSPLSGDLFIFLTRRANLVRMLFWDRDGFCLVSKRLEKGTFKRVRQAAAVQSGHIEVDVAELTLLLEGIEAKNLRRGPRWKPEKVT